MHAPFQNLEMLQFKNPLNNRAPRRSLKHLHLHVQLNDCVIDLKGVFKIIKLPCGFLDPLSTRYLGVLGAPLERPRAPFVGRPWPTLVRGYPVGVKKFTGQFTRGIRKKILSKIFWQN